MSDPSTEQNGPLHQQVRQFAADKLGVRPARLQPATTLMELGVDGQDAEDFLLAYAERFQVDFSEFEADRHVGPERGATPWSMLGWLVWLMFPRRDSTWAEEVGLEPVSMADLVRAAEQGRWTYG
ncbi:MAG: hypothetical protein CMJ58_21510 [Planctomycetaceae bacterium]|nr:hypothetical protein [Planctomycetaceae bacterium]